MSLSQARLLRLALLPDHPADADDRDSNGADNCRLCPDGFYKCPDQEPNPRNDGGETEKRLEATTHSFSLKSRSEANDLDWAPTGFERDACPLLGNVAERRNAIWWLRGGSRADSSSLSPQGVRHQFTRRGQASLAVADSWQRLR